MISAVKSLKLGLAISAFAGLSSSMSAQAASVLFKSNFGPGISLGAPYGFGTKGAYQDISGTDKETGYSWPVSALGANFSGVQLITVDPITSSTIGNYISGEIRSVPGPTGAAVNELFQQVKITGELGQAGSQAPLLIRRPWTIGEVTDLYITYWFKYQANLETQLDNTVSSANWRTQFSLKTGGYNNTGEGDYRMSVTVMKGADGKLYWLTKGDNAGGVFPTRVDYWRVDNHTVPVPIDKWFKFEVYWHRSSGTDGRFWAAADGQVVADYRGPNMGDYNLPITRIFVSNPYSGGHVTVDNHITGLEIWNGFPCGDGVPCYSPKDMTTPNIAITSPTSGSTVSGNVSVQVNASDNVGVSKVELLANGALVATSTASPFTLNWDSKTVPNSKVDLSAIAYDAAGNKTTSSIVSVNVNNPDITPPNVAITSPANGAVVSGSVTITSTASDDRGSAGITQYLYIDGSLKASAVGADLSYVWSIGSSKGKPKSTTHTISVTARDQAGNSSSKSITVFVQR